MGICAYCNQVLHLHVYSKTSVRFRGSEGGGPQWGRYWQWQCSYKLDEQFETEKQLLCQNCRFVTVGRCHPWRDMEPPG